METIYFKSSIFFPVYKSEVECSNLIILLFISSSVSMVNCFHKQNMFIDETLSKNNENEFYLCFNF